MKVLFLTLADVYDLSDHDIYQDLMRCFALHGHDVYVVTGAEKRKKLKTELYKSCGCSILCVKTGNQSNCSVIEKGISTVLLPQFYGKAIGKYFKNNKFDLILYATPPITLVSLIKRLKRKQKCLTYLMLKDIFPQNAVDLGMMEDGGLIYRYFRLQEKQLYNVSDVIGCMSPANIRYLKAHNALDNKIIEECPNALLPEMNMGLKYEERVNIRKRYNVPETAKLMIYGGNLGRPQGIAFLNKCLEAIKNDKEFFVMIVGDGSEADSIINTIASLKIENAMMINRLPREDYYRLISVADIGMIFLDRKFSIPNFPSRILPYMEKRIPIACVVDAATDVGDIAETNGFGWQCRSGDIDSFLRMMGQIKESNLVTMGEKGWEYLNKYYNTEKCYEKIVSKIVE